MPGAADCLPQDTEAYDADQDQLIVFNGKTLLNFLPRGLEWIIGFVSLMLAWNHADQHKLQAAISDYASMVAESNAVTSPLSPIQLYFQADAVATALLACARHHLRAHAYKSQEQSPTDWMTHSAHLQELLGGPSWIECPESLKRAFELVERSMD